MTAIPNRSNGLTQYATFLLHHYGGVYADLDCECVRPLDPLLPRQTLLLSAEPDSHLEQPIFRDRGFTQVLCNAWMASIPGHSFWSQVFQHLITYHHAPSTLDATGPFMLTRGYQSFLQQETARTFSPITLVATHLIYPLSTFQVQDAHLVEEYRQQALSDAFVIEVCPWLGAR